jgi:3-oxoacyl-[acyl-carrier-protein] synthase III
VVCAEKFSDKIGTVRTSRMIFGDGAGAIVVAPTDSADGDVEVLLTYASGTVSEVSSTSSIASSKVRTRDSAR